jgi:hypothetical protein
MRAAVHQVEQASVGGLRSGDTTLCPFDCARITRYVFEGDKSYV